MSALVADGIGSFTTPQLIFTGSRLRLNLETQRVGEVLVEVVEAAASGFGFAECDPLCGDLPAKYVTWRGHGDLGALAGRPISLRFRLRAAKLYSFQFE